jgi:hypothetical protein
MSRYGMFFSKARVNRGIQKKELKVMEDLFFRDPGKRMIPFFWMGRIFSCQLFFLKNP